MSDAANGQGSTGAGDALNADGQTGGTGDGQQLDAGKPAAGAGGKQTDDGKAAEVDYSFEVPEGLEIDQPSMDEFKGVAKELGLTKEGAAKLSALAVKREQARVEQHQKLVASWADEVKADKELGGDKLSANLAIAKKAIDLGPPELKALLDSSGLGNHPAVVRWALAVGKALSEDRFVTGKAPADTRAGDAASRLYPTTAGS